MTQASFKPRSREKLAWLLPPGFWALGMWIGFGPILLSGFGAVTVKRGDPRLVNYILEHGYRWLAGHPAHPSFWDPPLFFPFTNVSAFTDVLLGAGPLYWPWRLLGFEPDVAYLLWLVGVCAANFAGFYGVLRWVFSFSRLASSAGAYLFTFGSIRMANLVHLQLFPQFWVALGFAAVVVLFDARSSPGRRRGAIVALAAAFVLQVYTSFYGFFFFGLLLIVASLVAVARADTREVLRETISTHWRVLVSTLVVASAALLPLAVHYWDAYLLFGDFSLNMENVPRVYSWFLMGPGNLLYGAIQAKGGFLSDLRHPNQSGGLGVVTLVAILGGLSLLRARGGVIVLAVATLVLMGLASSYGEFTPWTAIRAIVPGAGGIRALGRISMVVLVPASIGLAAAVQHTSRRWNSVAAMALVAFMMVEQARRSAWIDIEYERGHSRAVAETVPADCGAFYLVCVGPRSCRNAQDEAMWTQLLTGIPTVNGRYGHFPPDFGLRQNQAKTSKERAALEEGLHRWIARNGLIREDVCWVDYRGYAPPPERSVYRWPSLATLGKLGPW